MLESLDPSVGLMSDMGLFSSESVLLDLDSNLSFENISWINEDLFEAHMDRYDHTYSQRTERNVEIDNSNSIDKSESNHDTEVRTHVKSTNETNEKDCEMQRKNKEYLETENHSQDSRFMPTIQQLPDSQLSQPQNPFSKSVSPGSSLSFLLEETCLDYDLNSLLDEEFELNNPVRIDHLQQPIEDTDLTRVDPQSCVSNEDKHSLVEFETSSDNSLVTLNEHNRDTNFLTKINESQFDQSSLINLDLSNAFDSLTRLDMSTSDSSDWSTLSTDVTDFSLDWDPSPHEPLSLEELFTRTFNEALDKGPLHTPPTSSDCYHQLEGFSDQTSAYPQWYDVQWDSSQEHSDTNGTRSPAMENMYPLKRQLPSENAANTKIESGHLHGCYEPLLDSNEPSGGTSHSPGKTKTSACKTEDPHLSRNRLGHVRKYQRISNTTSESLVRNFQCNYPECRKFYAKLSHLKAHLRRHSGERAFKCDWQDCAWQFSRSDELSRHRRSHYGIKPYPCTQCAKRFTRSDHLAKHLKVHERQKYKMMMKSLRKLKTKK